MGKDGGRVHPRHSKDDQEPGPDDAEARDRAREADLYLPEDGVGDLYGPDGKPIDREDVEEVEAEDPPEAECDYCGAEQEKRKVVYPGGRTKWKLPEDWRELPNGLIECPDCRAVPDAETGQMTRPPEEMR